MLILEAYTVLAPVRGFKVVSRIIHTSALKRWRGALVGLADLLRFGGWAIIIMGVLRLIVGMRLFDNLRRTFAKLRFDMFLDKKRKRSRFAELF